MLFQLLQCNLRHSEADVYNTVLNVIGFIVSSKLTTAALSSHARMAIQAACAVGRLHQSQREAQ